MALKEAQGAKALIVFTSMNDLSFKSQLDIDLQPDLKEWENWASQNGFIG